MCTVVRSSCLFIYFTSKVAMMPFPLDTNNMEQFSSNLDLERRSHDRGGEAAENLLFL